MSEDTIVAIITPLGESSISVIRLSGKQSIPIAESIFQSKIKLSNADSHTVHYGHIVDPTNTDRIDECLVTIMLAPRSYTAENVVEISCHGGLIAVKNVLDLLLLQGARLAEPGEFTKRAFLNGRIDLSQAEAVIDLIRSKSNRAHAIAMRQSQGFLSQKVAQLRTILIETMAHIEVNIDYPEHDVEHLTNTFIHDKCNDAIVVINQLLVTAEQGKRFREGIETVIIGKPNVGKSSLLNALSQSNRAIVTDIPGTTRDIIEEYVTLGGIPLKLLDTAGLRDTDDIVEKIGVERSHLAIASADLILYVINNHEKLSESEYQLLTELKNRQVIIVINKMDLESRIEIDKISMWVHPDRVVQLSAREHKGLDQLEQAITKLFFGGSIFTNDLTYVSNSRHIHLLTIARSSLIEAMNGVKQRVPIDMIQIDLRSAWETLGEIVGDTASDSLIDQIFSQFCLGK
jgi:tRNA modification GTPase